MVRLESTGRDFYRQNSALDGTSLKKAATVHGKEIRWLECWIENQKQHRV